MDNYIQELGKKPSKKNLYKLYYEMWQTEDLIINYHYSINQILNNQKIDDFTKRKKTNEIKEKIKISLKVISECREVINKISEVLENEKTINIG